MEIGPESHLRVSRRFEFKERIFPGEKPFALILCVIPLALILRRVKAFYEQGKMTFKINPLLFMDEFKLFGKNDEEVDSQVQTLHMFDRYVVIAFGLPTSGVKEED